MSPSLERSLATLDEAGAFEHLKELDIQYTQAIEHARAVGIERSIYLHKLGALPLVGHFRIESAVA
jgi:hypothetical protein